MEDEDGWDSAESNGTTSEPLSSGDLPSVLRVESEPDGPLECQELPNLKTVPVLKRGCLFAATFFEVGSWERDEAEVDIWLVNLR